MASQAENSPFTILIVHGSWHTPFFFTTIVEMLNARGYPVTVPQLPTCDPVAPHNAGLGLNADVVKISSEVIRLAEQESKDVLIVAHSYGGVIATAAVAPESSKEQRSKEGKAGGILGILYLTAFLPQLGISLGDMIGGELPSNVQEDSNGILTPRDPIAMFFSDVDPAMHATYVSHLTSQPRQPHRDSIDRAAYQYIPMGYVFCEDDRAIPLSVQEMMVRRVQAAGAKFREYRMTSAHEPFLSQPEVLLDIVLDYGATVAV